MIYEVISKYHDLSKHNKNQRYKSWEHCFKYFSSNYNILSNEQIFDHGCLHLAFYLASWGMLRGSSFLLQKDYRVHEYFLRDVFMNERYHRYLYEYLDKELDKNYIKGMNELILVTSNAYSNNITEVNDEQKEIKVTDTLSSKILLGVYGNVPAYDQYLKKALKIHGIKSQFNEESLMELVDFYNTYREDFERCKRLFKDEGSNYTSMKLIDMYFWQVGYLMDDTKLNHAELSPVLEFAANYYNQTQEKTAIHRKTGLTEEIRQFIRGVLLLAKSEGKSYVDLKSGDIHKALKLDNRMPPVCSAMVSLGVYKCEVIQDAPSGMSSTRVVRYNLC